MKRILCIWLPDWPLQRLGLIRPELKGRPVVLHELRRGAQRVAVASAAAQRLGAAAGMPLAEVAALTGSDMELNYTAEKSAGDFTKASRAGQGGAAAVVGLPYDPPGDRESLESLVPWCERFSPTVGIEASAAPDSLLLDIGGSSHLFGGEIALAEQAAAGFHRQGLCIHMAVADTIGAAWARAHFGQDRSMVAALPPGRFDALKALPVEALRLPESTVDLLHQLGIRRIEQLDVLPREEIPSRLGPELVVRWDQALGRRNEPIPTCRPPAEFQAEWLADYPTTRQETLAAAMESLVAEVAEQLVRQGHGALRLTCRLHCMSHDPVEVSVGLFEPTASAGHLCPLLQMQWERLRLPAPVLSMRVAATATAPLVFRQQTMGFQADDASGYGSRPLAGLIDRLSNRLGRQAVLGVRLVREALPELAYRYGPMVDSGGSKKRTGGWGKAQRCPRGSGSGASLRFAPATRQLALPPRPLRLLSRPIELTGVAVRQDGSPCCFHVGGQKQTIVTNRGPERIETLWWRRRSRGIQRDYYRAETTTGRHFWIFRRPSDGRWFLHGMFD